MSATIVPFAPPRGPSWGPALERLAAIRPGAPLDRAALWALYQAADPEDRAAAVAGLRRSVVADNVKLVCRAMVPGPAPRLLAQPEPRRPLAPRARLPRRHRGLRGRRAVRPGVWWGPGGERRRDLDPG